MTPEAVVLSRLALWANILNALKAHPAFVKAYASEQVRGVCVAVCGCVWLCAVVCATRLLTWLLLLSLGCVATGRCHCHAQPPWIQCRLTRPCPANPAAVGVWQ